MENAGPDPVRTSKEKSLSNEREERAFRARSDDTRAQTVRSLRSGERALDQRSCVKQAVNE